VTKPRTSSGRKHVHRLSRACEESLPAGKPHSARNDVCFKLQLRSVQTSTATGSGKPYGHFRSSQAQKVSRSSPTAPACVRIVQNREPCSNSLIVSPPQGIEPAAPSTPPSLACATPPLPCLVPARSLPMITQHAGELSQIRPCFCTKTNARKDVPATVTTPVRPYQRATTRQVHSRIHRSADPNTVGRGAPG